MKNIYLMRVLDGEDEVEVLKESVMDFLMCKSWTEFGERTGINSQTLKKFILGRLDLLKEKSPDLYKMYLKKTNSEYFQGHDDCVSLTDDVFRSLPKEISYRDFNNIMCKYFTKKSGNELIRIANKFGVEVIG